MVYLIKLKLCNKSFVIHPQMFFLYLAVWRRHKQLPDRRKNSRTPPPLRRMPVSQCGASQCHKQELYRLYLSFRKSTRPGELRSVPIQAVELPTESGEPLATYFFINGVLGHLVGSAFGEDVAHQGLTSDGDLREARVANIIAIYYYFFIWYLRIFFFFN